MIAVTDCHAEHEAIERIAELRAEMDAADGIEATRRAFSRFMRAHPLPDGATVSPATFGAVAGETIRPEDGTTTRAVLLAHGGGFVMGDPEDYRGLAGGLALALGAAVHIPDYRRAPEHPHPAQIEDLRSSWMYLLEESVDPAMTLFIGDSAGAALALSLLIKLRDEGSPLPACAATISGFFDLTLGSGSFEEVGARDPLLTVDALGGMVGAYTHGRDPADPAISPLAADLARLPPLLLLSGGRELIRDDSRRLAEAVKLTGGRADLSEFEDMFHIWPVFWRDLPQAAQALEQIVAFANTQFGTKS